MLLSDFFKLNCGKKNGLGFPVVTNKTQSTVDAGLAI